MVSAAEGGHRQDSLSPLEEGTQSSEKTARTFSPSIEKNSGKAVSLVSWLSELGRRDVWVVGSWMLSHNAFHAVTIAELLFTK